LTTLFGTPSPAGECDVTLRESTVPCAHLAWHFQVPLSVILLCQSSVANCKCPAARQHPRMNMPAACYSTAASWPWIWPKPGGHRARNEMLKHATTLQAVLSLTSGCIGFLLQRKGPDQAAAERGPQPAADGKPSLEAPVAAGGCAISAPGCNPEQHEETPPPEVQGELRRCVAVCSQFSLEMSWCMYLFLPVADGEQCIHTDIETCQHRARATWTSNRSHC
jgi:hypothetical protein